MDFLNTPQFEIFFQKFEFGQNHGAFFLVGIENDFIWVTVKRVRGLVPKFVFLHQKIGLRNSIIFQKLDFCKTFLLKTFETKNTFLM